MFPPMQREEVNKVGVVAAAAFALAGTTGNFLLPGHDIAWLSLFACSVMSFFASFHPQPRDPQGE